MNESNLIGECPLFLRQEVPISAVKTHLREKGIETR